MENPLENMPRIINLFESKNCLIVLEEYIEGITVEELLDMDVAKWFDPEKKDDTRYMGTQYYAAPEQPSIVHGDLWSGNFMTGPEGEAWLIDPALYVGSAETDIAMTELFGGFSERFYEAYKESSLLQPGYEDRRNIYNLYHMLNHFNLFETVYLRGVEGLIISVC